MAKTTTAGISKEEKKAARLASRAEKKERRKQMWQAFQMQRREDKRLLPYMIGSLVIIAGVITGIGVLAGMQWWFVLPLGIVLGALAAMMIFAKRVQSTVYKKADGTPGAAAWSMQNNMKGRWRITPSIAGTTQFDAVHRVIGRPGIILVGEGAPHRVKPLLAQEKKRAARVVGTTPIYDIIVGNEDGQIPLRKLNQHIMKLPRNISNGEVDDLEKRLNALGARSAQTALPKGPLPTGVKARNVQRAARRR